MSQDEHAHDPVESAIVEVAQSAQGLRQQLGSLARDASVHPERDGRLLALREALADIEVRLAPLESELADTLDAIRAARQAEVADADAGDKDAPAARATAKTDRARKRRRQEVAATAEETEDDKAAATPDAEETEDDKAAATAEAVRKVADELVAEVATSAVSTGGSEAPPGTLGVAASTESSVATRPRVPDEASAQQRSVDDIAVSMLAELALAEFRPQDIGRVAESATTATPPEQLVTSMTTVSSVSAESSAKDRDQVDAILEAEFGDYKASSAGSPTVPPPPLAPDAGDTHSAFPDAESSGAVPSRSEPSSSESPLSVPAVARVGDGLEGGDFATAAVTEPADDQQSAAAGASPVKERASDTGEGSTPAAPSSEKRPLPAPLRSIDDDEFGVKRDRSR